MKEKLIQLLNNSYSPYSKYPVSSIVVCNDGTEFSGVNVENANGTSICAERNAIHAAVSAGYKKGDFQKLYLMTKKLSVPCFACRQVLSEFFTDQLEVIALDILGNEKKYLIKELCPYPFTEDDLK
ncbi:MAG: cytidine deaminase [Mollicutes bacterium]|jgi:cytidine deaminase|nr:cytidine deaminase [Mollicutes bacterium]